MNRKITTAFVLAATTLGSAFAGQLAGDISVDRSAFSSTKSRAEVTAEFLAQRDRVDALTSEDSGSRYLARVRAEGDAGTQLAGQPRAAQ